MCKNFFKKFPEYRKFSHEVLREAYSDNYNINASSEGIAILNKKQILELFIHYVFYIFSDYAIFKAKLFQIIKKIMVFNEKNPQEMRDPVTGIRFIPEFNEISEKDELAKELLNVLLYSHDADVRDQLDLDENEN